MARLTDEQLSDLLRRYQRYLDGRINTVTGKREWDTFHGLPIPALLADLEEARQRVTVLENTTTAIDHQFQAASEQTDQMAECWHRCIGEKEELRQRAETAERERDEAREALRLIIDEAHSSARNSVDSLIEIIDIAGRALGEES